MPTVRLVNPSRKSRRRSSRKANKRRMPAALRRYWATHARNASRRISAGGRTGHMAKHRKRRRSSARRSRRSYRRRSNPLFALTAPRRHRKHHRRARSRGRRRNPSMTGALATGTRLLPMIGGGALGFLAARMIPQNLLPNYNKGFTGYLLNVGSGVVASYVVGELLFKNRQIAVGGYVGTGLAVLARIFVEQFNIGGGGGVSGDLDFDLDYYLSDRFPYPQGNGGPYDNYPGSPYLANAPFAATSAAAVRAGQGAAAALPAAAGQGMGFPAGGTGRWSDSRWT